jgi:hypothetical protein
MATSKLDDGVGAEVCERAEEVASIGPEHKYASFQAFLELHGRQNGL